MTDTQILDKAIEKAIKNGWGRVITYNSYRTEVSMHRMMYYTLIFSHDFVKAFWGDELIELANPDWCDNLPTCDDDLDHDTQLSWQYHLQQLVLEKEPLKYLEKFLVGG